ncbi:hypothetical protein ELD05_09760 [Caldicellulosiruptor changbaiensis]|uniref:Sensory rhodopsin transducer n=1 Tax=Caldicellulosiruptor changbaiensis TaxID=1222016 RepID=A0A3T0D725_9FIRM|nr:sensory rhodopsin transducer [Caldicellulosiruptor changbaiensis]AZT90905.1 hypothetical protein ELD05_09760 [Caldicellulosiruptor changbaiensis]
MKALGKKVWVIPDGYIPSEGSMSIPGHECLCIVNTGDVDAKVKLTVFFEDRDPIESDYFVVKAKRTIHAWLNKSELIGNLVIPKEVPYSLVVESDQNIVVQMSRLDTRLGNMALLSVIGFPLE